MGWFSSSEEPNEEAIIDSSAHVNTNIIIQEANDTHHQAVLSEKFIYGTYVLIGLEIVKLFICSYNVWKRHIKKRYKSTNNNNA